MDFSVLIQFTDLGPRSFPLIGLDELESDWRETVTEIITKPPVNDILKVSVYTPSLAEAVPITCRKTSDSARKLNRLFTKLKCL